MPESHFLIKLQAEGNLKLSQAATGDGQEFNGKNKITGKHLWQSLIFNKVAGLRPATLLETGLYHRCFPVNFAKFLRTIFHT